MYSIIRVCSSCVQKKLKADCALTALALECIDWIKAAPVDMCHGWNFRQPSAVVSRYMLCSTL
jgi:hypothetical protein